MPKKSESIDQPIAASSNGAGTPAAGGRNRARQRDTSEEPAQSSAEAPAAPPAAGSTGAEAGAAPAPLAGRRGEDYVKALKDHQPTTIEVPLLPNERRGDWERARGQKIPVTARQFHNEAAHWLSRDHALAALVIELQRPGATRFDQIDLPGSTIRGAIERLSDYTNQARLRAQTQTGKKWTASQVYLIPIEDA